MYTPFFEKTKEELKESLDVRTVVDHYLIAALWSSDDDDGESLDRNYDVSDVDRGSVKDAEKDVKNFLRQAKNLLVNVDDDKQVGHDFWLTRNGHGAGFWDRPEIYGKAEADALTKIAKKFGEKYMYVGDDGNVYVS